MKRIYKLITIAVPIDVLMLLGFLFGVYFIVLQLVKAGGQ